MGINKVDQKSFFYKLIWLAIKLWHHAFYYQKIEIAHKERVPKTGALIFTPNHQNALMDALAVLFSTKRTLVFLARADIFSKKFFAEILYFFRILPVYRPRDGQGEVKRNVETFEKTSEVLRKNFSLVLFPEGTHSEKQSLIPLKKGFVKIALQTEESNDFNLGIKLMPMAISYTNYAQCQTTLSINFGNPIDLKPFYESYKEHPAVAFNAVRDQLELALKDIMIHIDDDEFYKTQEFLLMAFAEPVLKKHKSLAHHRIVDGKAFLEKLNNWRAQNPANFSDLHISTQEFIELSKSLSNRQKIVFSSYSLARLTLKTLFFLIALPVILPSVIIQYPNYFLSNLPTRYIKDIQFFSSVRFVVGFLVVPIVFLAEWLVIKILFDELSLFQFITIYIFSILISTLMLNWLRNLSATWKIFIFSAFDKQKFEQLKISMNKIKKYINSI